MQPFMASRCGRQAHVADTVRLSAQVAKSAGGGMRESVSGVLGARDDMWSDGKMVLTFDLGGAVAAHPRVVHVPDLSLLCGG